MSWGPDGSPRVIDRAVRLDRLIETFTKQTVPRARGSVPGPFHLRVAHREERWPAVPALEARVPTAAKQLQLAGEELMLADLTILLHEMSDALRGRGAAARPAAIAPRPQAPNSAAIVVTGLASPQKARLVDALVTELDGIAVVVRSVSALSTPTDIVLRVHAETDLEAMVEGQSDDSRSARAADLVIPVDWEPLSRSLIRVTEALVARGADAARLGV